MRLPSLLAAALTLALPAVMQGQGEIKPVQAQTIQPYTAKTIEPYRSTTARADSARTDTARLITTVKDLPAPIKSPASYRADVKAFVGTWQLYVEGTSSTTDNYSTNTRTVTTSSGAKGRRLIIRANDTYDWGGRKGHWIRTGDGADGYPLELLKADDGRNWKIGWDTRRGATAGRILVWDGDVWEVGARR